jgi:hypothetical protein
MEMSASLRDLLEAQAAAQRQALTEMAQDYAIDVYNNAEVSISIHEQETAEGLDIEIRIEDLQPQTAPNHGPFVSRGTTP